MKDITLTARRQKKELCWLAGAFVVANLLNIKAISDYNAPASEIYTSIFYVLIFTVALYAVTVLLRLAGYGIYTLFRKK